MEKPKQETDLNNIKITTDNKHICINNPDYFLTFSDLDVSDGIDITENILILSQDTLKSKDLNFDEFIELTEDLMDENTITGSYIADDFKKLDNFTNSYEEYSIINIMSNDITIEDFTESLKVANSPKGFIDAEINLGQIILINKSLSPKLLIEIYKTCIKAKTRFFESLHLPLHINNLLNKEDFLVIASNLPEDSINDESVMDVGVDITQATYDDDYIDIPEFLNQIEESIIINCEDAVKKMGLNFGILDYLVSEGIQIGDLVEAGLDLCVGVEITDELKEKLEAEILKSLTDINVITLLMAAIRTEEDFQNNRLREVDISDDPAYLYTDEVLGLAISNQIAGTKATFNFKRYDEAKPGIIFGLGPMLDDIFAGLIAGCMSKIFEE
ncbi:MAG: phosphatidylglycerophosphatase A [Methanobacteriaceae archaeon]|nr:phosphatidylglycerophosphatase A [Methanobacteriaceae archaeon]